MKRMKILFIFVLLIILPITVNGLSIEELPMTITTTEGVEFYNNGNGYTAYTGKQNEVLHLNLQFADYLKVEGSPTFLLNDGVTVYNIKLIQSFDSEEGEEIHDETLVVPFSVTRQSDDTITTLLDNFQVVGYDLTYDKKDNSYKAYVPSDIDKAYVYVKTNGSATVVRGAGLIELNDKSTSVNIVVANPEFNDEEYKITIIKKNYILRTIIICSLIGVAIIGIILFVFKKYRDKVAIANPNSLNKGLGDINIDSIVKDANKEMNNISNENLESGVLAPRTPSNEEKNQ